MDDASEESATDQETIESLRLSVAALGREVQTLVEKVSALTRSVEALSRPSARPAGPRGPVTTETAEGKQFSLVVSPLPELAMVAVAETSLRGLPSVRRMAGVTRDGDEARFALEVDPDGDLVEEMRNAMPVELEVESSSGDELVISLEWVWGRSASA